MRRSGEPPSPNTLSPHKLLQAAKAASVHRNTQRLRLSRSNCHHHRCCRPKRDRERASAPRPPAHSLEAQPAADARKPAVGTHIYNSRHRSPTLLLSLPLLYLLHGGEDSWRWYRKYGARSGIADSCRLLRREKREKRNREKTPGKRTRGVKSRQGGGKWEV